MSGHTLGAVYETYEELYGHKSSIDELIAKVSKYERSSLLWICAEIVCRVQLWARAGARNRPNYLRYLQELYEPSVSQRLIAGETSVSPPRSAFHRRQIGLVAKLALQYGGSGLDARECRGELGVLFLMANDHLDYGLLQNMPVNADAREYAIRLVTEMLAAQEGSSPAISNLFTRGHLMLARYAQELSGAHDYVDVVGEFERKIGLTLAEFEAMLFAVHSRFGAAMSNKVVGQPGLLPLRREEFREAALTPEKVEAFLKFVSIPPDDLRDEIQQSDAGANDATSFRKYPMVHHVDPRVENALEAHLMIDNLTLLEKAQTGPYWVVNEGHSGNLRTFWGAVFERYVNDLLTRACAGTSRDSSPIPGSTATRTFRSAMGSSRLKMLSSLWSTRPACSGPTASTAAIRNLCERRSKRSGCVTRMEARRGSSNLPRPCDYFSTAKIRNSSSQTSTGARSSVCICAWSRSTRWEKPLACRHSSTRTLWKVSISPSMGKISLALCIASTSRVLSG
jgi:hypothetical protein